MTLGTRRNETLNQKLKLLQSLFEEACRRLKKDESEKRKLADQVKEIQGQNEELQIQMRDYHTLTSRQKKVRGRIEKLLVLLEQLDKRVATDGSERLAKKTEGNGSGGGA